MGHRGRRPNYNGEHGQLPQLSRWVCNCCGSANFQKSERCHACTMLAPKRVLGAIRARELAECSLSNVSGRSFGPSLLRRSAGRGGHIRTFVPLEGPPAKALGRVRARAKARVKARVPRARGLKGQLRTLLRSLLRPQWALEVVGAGAVEGARVGRQGARGGSSSSLRRFPPSPPSSSASSSLNLCGRRRPASTTPPWPPTGAVCADARG